MSVNTSSVTTTTTTTNTTHPSIYVSINVYLLIFFLKQRKYHINNKNNQNPLNKATQNLYDTPHPLPLSVSFWLQGTAFIAASPASLAAFKSKSCEPAVWCRFGVGKSKEGHRCGGNHAASQSPFKKQCLEGQVPYFLRQ